MRIRGVGLREDVRVEILAAELAAEVVAEVVLDELLARRVKLLRPCRRPNASWIAASTGLAVTSVHSFGIGRASFISRVVSAAALRYSGSSA